MLLPRTRTEATVCLLPLLCAASLCAQEDEAIARFDASIKAEQFAQISGALESYTAAHPQSWQALYQLGYVDFRLHRFQQSLTMLCKSLVLNPKFAESHKILAYDLNILGRQDLAVPELERALKYDSASAESHYELGRIYYEQGSYLKAIDHLEKAKSLAAGYVRVYHNLGLAYSAIADNAKAVENFDIGIRLNAQQSKRSAWPLIDYATYFNMQNKFEKARDLLLQAIEIDHSWDQEYDELARAYRGLGQTEQAINALKQAIVLNPRKAEYHYVLARLYRQTHQLAQANEQLSEYEHQKSSQKVNSRPLIAVITLPLLAVMDSNVPGTFVDITSASHINFRYIASHTSKRYLLETMGSGVALFDFDNDGLLDIFFVNGAPLRDRTPQGAIPQKTGPEYWNRLFHQKSDGTFEDVTQKAGLQSVGYGMGVAVGDYDNDGYEDLYVTAYGANKLYHDLPPFALPDLHTNVSNWFIAFD